MSAARTVRRYTDADQSQVAELAARGVGASAIARQTGIAYSTVYRWLHPEYAERQRITTLAAKRRRTGTCRHCGGATRLNDGRHGTPRHPNGASTICRNCSPAQQHDHRYWTPERIVDRLRVLAQFLGRTPCATDSLFYYARNEAAAWRRAYSPERIAEVSAIPDDRRPPHTALVYREFGSWGAALDAAGLPRPKTGSPSHRKPGAENPEAVPPTGAAEES